VIDLERAATASAEINGIVENWRLHDAADDWTFYPPGIHRRWADPRNRRDLVGRSAETVQVAVRALLLPRDRQRSVAHRRPLRDSQAPGDALHRERGRRVAPDRRRPYAPCSACRVDWVSFARISRARISRRSTDWSVTRSKSWPMAASDTARVRLAHGVDEAKDIRDKALALAEYARQAKDVELQAWVTEIRLRAERRTGELLAETSKAPGARAVGTGRGKNPTPSSRNDSVASVPTLKSLGITRDQSSNWQALVPFLKADMRGSE
jgi:hypothetical protein